MRSHKDKQVKIEDVLRHPADVEPWKHFDCEFSDFALDSQNVRSGLTSYEFNLFGNMSTSYSIHNPTAKTSKRFPEDESNLHCVSTRGEESEGQDDARLKPLVVNGVEIRVDDLDLAALLALVEERKKARQEKEEAERR
ncbi:uncharacterized protein E5676_scaffold506G001010 [Cucumis melo var. makuwa]|uniref:Uncharacterized protein n=1 Tax=Cucumis melo var. makuwa TaxID=1194695 RepID=A0A5D3BFS5_CUCMM|nr:uncharacterized protein E6C27_scaffold270G002340 [Cucumis melo var. makuwa]TYJ97038.1 uncharacterized protein E5676_scaffold506G001010 [Cucumis melo var. makuwa]